MSNDQDKIKDKEESKKDSSSKTTSFGKTLYSVIDGSILTREKVLKLLPFILFITLLAIIYIANSYHSLKTVKKIEVINKELIELRHEYVTTKSGLMYQSKQSMVAKRLAEYGIKESLRPPVKIFVNKEEE